MAINTQKLTVEAFWEQYAGQPYELVNGEIMAMPPAGMEASFIALQIGTYINLFVMEHKLGWTTTADGGYMLDNLNLRAPDVAFTSHERLPQQQDFTKYGQVPPDLAVEVVSPNDSAGEVQHKVALYMEKGVTLVWVVYPKTRTVYVHRPDADVKVLKDSDTLTGGDVLPGFTLSVRSIFPAPQSEA
ncbi:MAG: Uma2 family endonuclease [Chloroflexota bacterium]